MHRLQHSVSFLWKLHSYHHRVTDLQATNTLVSHPIDFALRNVVFGFVLGIIGFNPLALVIATAATFAPGIFSHCGGDVKGGFLNYFFVTPEVHRWHHSAKVPQGYGYSCNYGVEFSFRDIIFRTFYLPVKNGVTEQPEFIGYPSGGLPDESNYLKLLLAPLGLYRPLSWFRQPDRDPDLCNRRGWTAIGRAARDRVRDLGSGLFVAWRPRLAHGRLALFGRLDEHARRITADAATNLADDGRAGGSRRDATVRCEHGVPFLGDAGVLVNAHRARDPQRRLTRDGSQGGCQPFAPPAILGAAHATPISPLFPGPYSRCGATRHRARDTWRPYALPAAPE
jgi:Fatty acid hydroxylase superfamily